MSAVIKLTGLTKAYGKSRGIENVDLEVGKGSIFGFLGPNGAGKTTTISVLVDLLRPTHGKAEVFGMDTVKNGVKIRQKVGYLSGDMALDGALTGEQQLQYYGAIRGTYDKKYVAELAAALNCDLHKKIKGLSRGNRQKIGLISALMHKPELLILDEPTSGLDPLIQEQFNVIIKDHQKAGNTTFISSHVLSEVQELCDYIAFIKDGKVIASEPITAIAKNAPYQIMIVSDDRRLAVALEKLPEVHLAANKHNVYNFAYSGHIDKLLGFLSKYKLIDITVGKADLESTFMELYKD